MAAYLFNLPDLDFTVSFGDNQCCDRCGHSTFCSILFTSACCGTWFMLGTYMPSKSPGFCMQPLRPLEHPRA